MFSSLCEIVTLNFQIQLLKNTFVTIKSNLCSTRQNEILIEDITNWFGFRCMKIKARLFCINILFKLLDDIHIYHL